MFLNAKYSEREHHDVLVIQLTLYSIRQHNFLILKHYKQGYMFRLNVSHLQAHKIFSLPDALPTLGPHSVYNFGTQLIKTF